MEHSKRHIPPSWNFTSPIKDVFWIKNCTLQTLIPESFKNSILAGLLTYSIFLTPFPFLQSGTVDLSIVGKLLAELTAAGLFRIYTWFPFNRFPRRGGANQCMTKIRILFEKTILWVINFLPLSLSFCRQIGKVLPPSWQDFVTALAKLCHRYGKSLPKAWQ